MGFFSSLFGKTDSQLTDAIKKQPLLVDVRTPGEFRAGSIPGAVNIPLDMLNSQLSKCRGKNCIVVFCASGMRSSQAKGILERNGFTDVINGGSWKNVQTTIVNISS